MFALSGGAEIPVPADMAGLDDGDLILGFRPHHLSPHENRGVSTPLSITVWVTEITGSESFVHLTHSGDRWVMLTNGIHDIAPGTSMTVYLDTRHLLAFRKDGTNATSPQKLAA